jgi:hypothetical protein
MLNHLVLVVLNPVLLQCQHAVNILLRAEAAKPALIVVYLLDNAVSDKVRDTVRGLSLVVAVHIHPVALAHALKDADLHPVALKPFSAADRQTTVRARDILDVDARVLREVEVYRDRENELVTAALPIRIRIGDILLENCLHLLNHVFRRCFGHSSFPLSQVKVLHGFAWKDYTILVSTQGFQSCALKRFKASSTAGLRNGCAAWFSVPNS